jgi:DNA-binding MarR family transcriptional regulator
MSMSLREEAVAALFSTSALLDAIRLQLWDRQGLTVTQLRLLGHLREKEGLSNAELADLLYVTRPSVSALLERLERGGFIRREVSPTDRRGIRIWLEDSGRAAVESARGVTHPFAHGLIEDLSDEQVAEIVKALNTLVEAGRARREAELRATADSSE